jgi:signal transduction histidine kinase
VSDDDAAVPTDHHLEALTLGGDVRLQDLANRDSLRELVRSFHALFGISLRIFTADGSLLAESVAEQPICAYVGSFSQGRTACMKTVAAARKVEPESAKEASHPCFTGAEYRIFAIEYDARLLGKAVLGPFLPAGTTNVPASLLKIDSGIDAKRSLELLPRMPRAKPDTITLIVEHVRRTLDLILFSGHKSLLTSQMHISSVRESYRELEEKNAKLQEAFDRLRELDRLKSNFLGVISHELRTPLTSIIGYSEMLSEGIAGPLAADQKKFVETIHEKGEQLLQLIMSLLDLSKLESGTLSLRKKNVNIRQLLTEVASTVEPKARKSSISVELGTDGNLPPVQGDPERLRQVFINLADNAIKFSPEKSVVRITATMAEFGSAGTDEGFSVLEPLRRMIEVRVIDSGRGVPEEERDRIFDPFYQVDSSSTRQHEGTGLGLSIVKRLVDAHAGRVRVGQNDPTGAVFSVLLPIAGSRTDLMVPIVPPQPR